jgi:serine/threonine protein kinase
MRGELTVGSSATVQVVSGTIIGSYIVERKLAQGGMSVLFLAHDTQLDRPVALKMLAEEVATPAMRARMLREARTLAAVDHAGIVRIHGTGEHEGKPWIAMELVRGTDLKRLLAERGAVTPNRALRWVLQAAEALAAAHDVGVVHRDLKPSNLLLTHEDKVKVVDFGVAKRRVEATASGDVLTSQGEIVGTPAYLSPEQLEHGLADERSDVWGLGCVLYELCSGAPPFGRANSAATTAAILRDEPVYTALTGSVVDVLQACLRKNSFARVASMRELAALLRDALEQSHAQGAALASTRPSERVSAAAARAPSARISVAAPSASAVPTAARPSDAPPRPSEAPRPSVRTSAASGAGRARSSAAAPSLPPVAASSLPSPSLAGVGGVAGERPSGLFRDPSTSMRVTRGRMKGTAIRTGLLWFADHFGADTVARLWEKASPDVKSLIRLDDPSFGIVASAWYETRLVGELLTMLEEAAGTDDPEAWASALADAIAKDNVSGVYRSLFRLITTPAMLEANAQRVWRTYCDEGIFIVQAPRAGELQMEIRHWTHHHARTCRVVGYAIQQVLRAVGYEGLVVERTLCVSEGDPTCAFEGMYLPK